MFSKNDFFTQKENFLLSETLAHNEDGTPKFQVQLTDQEIFLQKELYSKQIATFSAAVYLFKPDVLCKKQQIEEQLTSVLEVCQALNEKHLEADDGAAIVKESCQIVPLLEENIGFQCSIFFSANGVRPTASLRKLRKSSNTGRFYFGREVNDL